jgi:hypothetical protein
MLIDRWASGERIRNERSSACGRARGGGGNRNLNQIVGKLWKRLGIIFSKPSTASNWHGS